MEYYKARSEQHNSASEDDIVLDFGRTLQYKA